MNTYNQGDIVDLEVNIVAHHNGYFEFYVCNVDVCGKDISTYCFRRGHCEQLMRAPSFCDSGDNEDCGPIDSLHRGRWYLPCGLFPKGQSLYGGVEKGTMKFQLPLNLHCDHCVIQWYWTAANTCNPPGVVHYFEGPDGPRWPLCRGQGGAVGGYTSKQRECGGDNFPEEYWQCSDIRIIANSASQTTDAEKRAAKDKEIKKGDSKGQGVPIVPPDSSHSSPISSGISISADSLPGSLSTFMNFGKEDVKKPRKTSGGSESLKNHDKRRHDANRLKQVADPRANSGERGTEAEQLDSSELSAVVTADPTVSPTLTSKAFPHGTSDMLSSAFNSGFPLMRNGEKLLDPSVSLGGTNDLAPTAQSIENSVQEQNRSHVRASTEAQLSEIGTSQSHVSGTKPDNGKFLLLKVI